MKLLLTLTLTFVISITFAQSDYVWEKYDSALLITKDNAKTIENFENTPESIVSYFYASKIRKDNKWIKVLPNEEDRSERLKQKLITYEKWTVTQFKLVSKTEFQKNKIWVKVFFEIEINGQKDSGTDEVTVEMINRKWIITSIPT